MDGFPVDMEILEEASIKYIQGFHFYRGNVGMIRTALRMTLNKLNKDLVQDLVLGLEWDGKSRLETWGSQYFECANPKIANEWGRLLMTSLAFRLAQPGIKCDIVPILVGAQGIGKTTFFEELSVFDGHLFYQELMKFSSDANDETRSETTKFKVATVIDLGEGVVFSAYKTNTDLMKQRLTQTIDTYRPVYSPYVIKIPRSFIFVGTSNRKDLLSDGTGSRRFFILEAIRIAKLAYEEKMQILAEVIAKKDKLLASNWYDIQLTREDLIVEEKDKHITNVQALLNVEFTKVDNFEQQLLELIENDRVAKYKDGRGYFVSTKYLYAQLNTELRLDGDKLTNRMSRLMASTTFRYRCEKAKPEERTLDFPSKGIQDLYMAGINNSQRMVTGYQLLK
jgi:predicted P-loop ATPase